MIRDIIFSITMHYIPVSQIVSALIYRNVLIHIIKKRGAVSDSSDSFMYFVIVRVIDLYDTLCHHCPKDLGFALLRRAS